MPLTPCLEFCGPCSNLFIMFNLTLLGINCPQPSFQGRSAPKIRAKFGQRFATHRVGNFRLRRHRKGRDYYRSKIHYSSKSKSWDGNNNKLQIEASRIFDSSSVNCCVAMLQFWMHKSQAITLSRISNFTRTSFVQKRLFGLQVWNF